MSGHQICLSTLVGNNQRPHDCNGSKKTWGLPQISKYVTTIRILQTQNHERCLAIDSCGQLLVWSWSSLDSTQVLNTFWEDKSNMTNLFSEIEASPQATQISSDLKWCSPSCPVLLRKECCLNPICKKKRREACKWTVHLKPDNTNTKGWSVQKQNLKDYVWFRSIACELFKLQVYLVNFLWVIYKILGQRPFSRPPHPARLS